MEKYKEKLAGIQWLTHNQKFNEKQHIQIGDAIAAFADCIKKNEELVILLLRFKEELICWCDEDFGKECEPCKLKKLI